MLNSNDVASWLNANEGVLALGLFTLSAAFAWFSGIISALRRRPRLKIKVTPGPTVCTVVPTGRQHEGIETHRIYVSLYLHVANAGSAPTSIGNIRVGFKWPLRRFASQWWKKSLGWDWIEHQSIALADFQTILNKDGDTKVYPFLTQKSFISGDAANTYLDIGEMTNGVVYFESAEAWGGCQPTVRNGQARVKVEIEDAFGGLHCQVVEVPVTTLEEAKRYNPRFGESMESVKALSDAVESEMVPPR